ncbi:uncharacterized protein CEXT_411371 [Caerostris extrusa]|uniref:Uncharacterized protein n=1 Tax=Caerostris extrusa TaxID=172846 RepID=A0AAV4XAC6_CAEEX|nr:uncharacterized protein CEXT_411371 [Caerostris extrusa]
MGLLNNVETSASKEENSSSFENDFIYSSPKSSNNYETSSLNISDEDFNLNITETLYLPKTDPESIIISLNLLTSISQSVRESAFSHPIKEFITTEASSTTLESSLRDTGTFLSSTFDSYQFYDSEIDAITTFAAEVSPTAERRIYIPSSQTTPSLPVVSNAGIDWENSEAEASFSNFDFIEVSTIQATTTFSDVDATKSLPQDETVSSSYSNLFSTYSTLVEISDSSTAGSPKLRQPVLSSVMINEPEFPIKVQNEDPQLDEIISGIVHLIAGKVQLGGPVQNVFGPPPKRLNRPFHSTRINNRGPISSSTPYSRTVVVFFSTSKSF